MKCALGGISEATPVTSLNVIQPTLVQNITRYWNFLDSDMCEMLAFLFLDQVPQLDEICQSTAVQCLRCFRSVAAFEEWRKTGGKKVIYSYFLI